MKEITPKSTIDDFIRRDGVSLLERKRTSTPNEFAAYVRSLGKVFFWEGGGFWVISDYEIAKKALRDPALSCDRSSFFISRMPNLDLSLIPDFFDVVQKMMVMSDGKKHQQRRAVAQRVFSEEIIHEYKRIARGTVDRLLNEMESRSHTDFAAEVAKKLPSLILADLFSIAQEDRPDFFHWSLNMTRFFGGASQYRNQDGIEVNSSAKGIVDYFQRLVKKRRASPSDDFLSLMIEENAKVGLTNDELVAQAVMMLVAGQVTTSDQINNNLFTLLSNPDVHQDLRRNPELVPLAVEEFNRWDPGVTFLFRVAVKPATLGEVTIPEKSVVFISNHAIHREPTVFTNPQVLDIRRSPNPHFAYGHGAHYCLGAPLARLQMNYLFTEVLERFPDLELLRKNTPQRDHYSLAFSGFKSLPLQMRSNPRACGLIHAKNFEPG